MATRPIDHDIRRRLETVERFLIEEFDDLSAALVQSEVRNAASALLREARIQDYVPLLTHRHAYERLTAHRGSALRGGEASSFEARAA